MSNNKNLVPLEVLTLSKLASLIKVHQNTLRNWDRNGVLKAVHLGRRGDRRYRQDDIMIFIEQKKDIDRS